MGLKAKKKEKVWSRYPGSGNVKPFLASAGLHVLKGDMTWKVLHLQKRKVLRIKNPRKNFKNTVYPHYRFCICKFSYFLKCIYNFIDTCSAFVVICRHTEWWKLCFWMHMFPEGKQGRALPSCFSFMRRWPEDRDGRGSAVQWKKLSSGAPWRGFESQCWHLLLMWPQANGLPLLGLIFSFVKWKIKSTKMSCFCI